MNQFDIVIFRWLNSFVFQKNWIDVGIIFKSEFLGWWILGILALLLVFSKNKMYWLKVSFYALFSGVVSRFVFTEAIRFIYNRPRPFEVLDSVNQLVFHSPGGSFPSGHSAFFFALAVSVFFFNRVWGIMFFVFSLSMGVGRVAAGLHWPTDILGGMAVGIFSAWIVQKIRKRLNAA